MTLKSLTFGMSESTDEPFFSFPHVTILIYLTRKCKLYQCLCYIIIKTYGMYVLIINDVIAC